MSTYLLLCVVGKFETTEIALKNGIKVRGLTPEGYSASVKHFMQLASEAIEFYEDYFGVPYPLPKLDLVSVHAMEFRAMENWGAITFLSKVLLLDPETTPAELIQRNARSVAHEISHMWFGNLVTLKWWDDIWLNEGFARYLEHHVLDTLRPSFRSWDKYLQQVYQNAVEADWVLAKTHPVQITVPDPDSLSDVFDNISYAKGSVICRMIHAFVGDDDLFKKCLSTYIKKYSFKNTETRDLLNIIDELLAEAQHGAGIKCSEFILPWIQQPCFPVLRATRTGPKKYMLQQYCVSSNVDERAKKLLWPIQVNWMTNKGLTGSLILKERSKEFSLEDKVSEEEEVFVYFNHGMKGFYITIYDDAEFKKMAEHLGSFSEADRFGMLYTLTKTS